MAALSAKSTILVESVWDTRKIPLLSHNHSQLNNKISSFPNLGPPKTLVRPLSEECTALRGFPDIDKQRLRSVSPIGSVSMH